jgi:iron-sulfur cluster insertion protein
MCPFDIMARHAYLIGVNAEVPMAQSAQQEAIQDAGIALSASAAKRIRELAAKEAGAVKLRLAVSGGGCSGFSYGFAFDEQVQDDDLVVTRDGATLLVDSVSLDLLRGSEVDYVDDLVGASFQVRNPNAVSSCGCGTSFSV